MRPHHEFLREKVYEMHLYILHKSKVSRQLGPKTTSKYITATNLTENYQTSATVVNRQLKLMHITAKTEITFMTTP